MPAEQLAAIPLDELVERALAIADREADDAYPEIVAELQRRGDRPTFARAVALCESSSESQQRLGVDILGQLGGATFADESLPVVLARCTAGGSGDLLRDALLALGQLGDPRGLDVALQHVRHPDADVRFGVIHALGGIAGDPAPEAVVDAAIELTRDPDDDVRNWATFVLGMLLSADGAPARDALAARLDDVSVATRAEAAAGLVARGDRRAADHVLAWLESPELPDDDDGYAGSLLVETAARLADPRFLPALRALQERAPDEQFDGWLELAISTCSGEPFPDLEDV